MIIQKSSNYPQKNILTCRSTSVRFFFSENNQIALLQRVFKLDLIGWEIRPVDMWNYFYYMIFCTAGCFREKRLCQLISWAIWEVTRVPQVIELYTCCLVFSLTCHFHYFFYTNISCFESLESDVTMFYGQCLVIPVLS